MARWKLTDSHYLAVEGTEWEYKEQNRETGRQARKVYEVPLHLDPKNPADHNYPKDEAIIVSNKFNPAYPRDYIFRGTPTPDMEPMDDEAQAISDGERKNWIHPIEALNMTYSESRLSEFERGIAELLAKGVPKMSSKPMPALSLSGVDPEAFERMQQQIATLMEQNAKLEKALSEAPRRRL
jgi:hypothetical protein